MTNTETRKVTMTKLELAGQMQHLTGAIQDLTDLSESIELNRQRNLTREEQAEVSRQLRSIASRKAELIQERDELRAELEAPREQKHQIELSTSELETLAQLVVDYETSPNWNRETSEKLGDIWVELIQHRRPQD